MGFRDYKEFKAYEKELGFRIVPCRSNTQYFSTEICVAAIEAQVSGKYTVIAYLPA